MKLLFFFPLISLANPISIIENKFLSNVENYSTYVCGESNTDCKTMIQKKIQYKNISYSHAKLFSKNNHKSIISLLYEHDPDYLDKNLEKIFHFR